MPDEKKKIAFFDVKPYERERFDAQNTRYRIKYFENKLTPDTAPLAAGCEAVCAFVNDDLSAATIEALAQVGVRVIVMRCAGYNNVDVKAAYQKITVLRVPAYSPHAVAEHAMALLLCLNRKVHKAYNRTRDYNFSLNRLVGFELYEKTVGVIGTGKIGRVFIDLCRGFGMKVLAYDPFPAQGTDIEYVPLETLLHDSDVISLHCPLTDQTRHVINADSLKLAKPGVIILNTSRGGLIDSEALLAALKEERVRAAGLDVYEEESDLFFEDYSDTLIKDDVLALFLSLPNVIITSHQAFLTDEALHAIVKVTLQNLDDYFDGKLLENEVCYRCKEGNEAKECRRTQKQRCF